MLVGIPSGEVKNSLKRERPRTRSRTTSRVQRSPRTSSALATGQGERWEARSRTIFFSAIPTSIPDFACFPQVFCFLFASMTSQDPDVLPLPALPRLAAPGAGLPPLELQVSRLLFRAAQLVSTRVRATAQLARTRETLQRLAGKCPEEEGRRRVLIRRLPGMEDSSRYWSVFMTVEHVAIVTTAVAGIMRELSAGRIPT